MQKKAIDAAKSEWERAEEFADVVAKSDSFPEVEAAWKSFLIHSKRVSTKLEQGAKTDGKSNAWWGRKVHERKTDPLLCYLWHSRNADEHTLQEIAELKDLSVKQVEPSQEELDAFHEAMAKQPHPYAPLALLEIVPRHVKLLDVVDSGRAYPVPQEHRGNKLDNTSPGAVAKLALNYLKEVLQEADGLAR
jgi:hypothetical protein